MSMLTVWILWEIMSVTVLQDTLEMEHTALVRKDLVKQNCVSNVITEILPVFNRECVGKSSSNLINVHSGYNNYIIL